MGIIILSYFQNNKKHKYNDKIEVKAQWKFDMVKWHFGLENKQLVVECEHVYDQMEVYLQSKNLIKFLSVRFEL